MSRHAPGDAHTSTKRQKYAPDAPQRPRRPSRRLCSPPRWAAALRQPERAGWPTLADPQRSFNMYHDPGPASRRMVYSDCRSKCA
eukprot:6439208-Prymnesium_polylepis.1